VLSAVWIARRSVSMWGCAVGDNTGIEWTDATWNPLRGCSRVSEGCRNCYAETVAGRFSKPGLPYEGLIAKGGQWNGQVRLLPELLAQPYRWVKPRRIFVNSMSDLFHESVPFEFIASVFAVMGITTRHTYQILTKRPERMLAFFEWLREDDHEDYDRIMDHWPEGLDWTPSRNGRGGYDNCGPGWPYENVWLGVSVEDQATADARIPLLLEAPAAVRWISAEPLLGSVDIAWALGHRMGMAAGFQQRGRFAPGFELLRPLDWVVVGGESGAEARPMHPDWARSLRDQCADEGVPFLFKQWGEWMPRGLESMDYPLVDGVPRIRFTDLGENGSDLGAEGENHVWMQRAGKKPAGRLLDGVLHDGYPGVANA